MKKNGFMLVEIMIVVVIVGILAAIVIPQFAAEARKEKERQAALAVAGQMDPNQSSQDPNQIEAEGYPLDNCDILFLRNGCVLIKGRGNGRMVAGMAEQFAEGLDSLYRQGYKVTVLPSIDLPTNYLAVWAVKENK